MLVRKYFVSKGHRHHPGQKKDFSNMMNHSEDTTVRSYFLAQNSRNVGKTFLRMHTTMQTQKQIVRTGRTCETETIFC